MRGTFKQVRAIVGSTLLVLGLQGCAMFDKPDVYRGLTQQEAQAFVLRQVGGAVPASTKLNAYYSMEIKWSSWGSPWKCNMQHARIELWDLVLTQREGNSFEGTRTSLGDCITPSSDPVAGRFDDNAVYMYFPREATTYVSKFRIERKRGVAVKLVFMGQYKYINDEVKLHPPRANPLYGVSGEKIAESGGPADMWESTEYLAADEDPRPTAAQRRRERFQEENASNGRASSEIAQRKAEYDADQRAFEQQQRQRALAQLNAQLDQKQVELDTRREAQARAAQQQAERSSPARPSSDARPSSPSSGATRASAGTGHRAAASGSTAVANAAAAAARAAEDKKRAEAAEAERKKQLAEAETARAAQRAKEQAEREAAKRAQVEAERSAKAGYLAQLTSGTRLYARSCPDGKGKHYMVGTRPRIKPEVVSCIDVYYRAACPGSASYSRGVAKNFLGASTDCFMGDAVEIDPTPACDVKQVRVEVEQVRGCGE